MNTNITKGTWKEFKGELKKQWGDLTDDELEKTEGNIDKLVGSIQIKYGLGLDKAQSEINSILENINNKLS